MSGGVEPPLAAYLQPSPDQRRLLEALAAGHARGKHGRELGNPPPAAYRARVRAHLRRASIGVALEDSRGRPRYLLADPARNQVAWITPHKEHRSTFFAPRQGASAYVRSHLAAATPQRRRTLDLTAIRVAVRTAARAPAHRAVASSDRATRRTSPARVP